MDRNYFLSFSRRIAFLLVMLAMGNLNAKFISTIIRRHTIVLNSIDVNNHNQQTHLTGFSAFKLAWALESLLIVNTNHYERVGADSDSVHKTPHTIIQQRNFLIVENNHFFFLKNVTLFPTWSKLINLNSVDTIDIVAVLEKIKKFHTNFLKMVDGFKFIIKIPDKLTFTFI